jgi:hypothetical protein
MSKGPHYHSDGSGSAVAQAQHHALRSIAVSCGQSKTRSDQCRSANLVAVRILDATNGGERDVGSDGGRIRSTDDRSIGFANAYASSLRPRFAADSDRGRAERSNEAM